MLTSVMGLSVFLDSEELELGDNLPTELKAAMKTASLHIAIFSENYAKSRWCLDELSFMCTTGTKIVPIFYHVKPEDVRYAKGVYAAAFEEHKQKRRYRPEKIQEWKDALSNVSNNIGDIINNKEDEDMLLKNITYCVRREFKKLPLVVAEHAVGLDETVKDFELTALQYDRSHHNVQMVGIWGMGGSGKTTLAKKLYNNIYPSMEKASLILDVRHAANKNTLFRKQKKLLQDLGFKSVSVDNIEEGKAILASNLRSIRALIVLDDVDHVDQLNALLSGRGSESLIGSGSFIIVTTRELEVLRCWNISSLHKMKPPNAVHAKQLFCWHAFLQPSPLNGFEELAEKFLKTCSGLPLSLKVLGGQLYGNLNKESWESLLDKLSRIVHKDIKDKLKINFDALDVEEQEVFLDIACSFIGEKGDLAIELWTGSGYSGLHSLEKLINKCLVEIDETNSIRMHDHFRDLGREIANAHSLYRLWSPQQRIQVCNEHAELTVDTNRGIQMLAPSRLGLKFIAAQGCNLNHVISEASRDLVWLRWLDSGQTNLQSLIALKKLRILELKDWRNCSLRELWVAECDAPLQLRQLIISDCGQFQGFPSSIGRLKQLKKIVLKSTKCLESLPEEFGLLQSLEHLELKLCQALSSLPNSMGNLRNLRYLSLYGCGKLRRLPDSCKELTLLQYLDLSLCFNITFRADIMVKMSKLEYLNFSYCNELEELPLNIANQGSLRELDLNSMWTLRELTVNIGQLGKLQKLRVGGGSLTSLPVSLGNLSSLTTLQIDGCSKLQCLPDSVGDLSLLERLDIRSSGVKYLPESINQLINLESLKIEWCPVNKLDIGAGSSTSFLCKLKTTHLSFNDLLYKISIPKDCCTGLETLTLVDNNNLTEIEGLPSSVRKLEIIKCPKLSALPSFAQLTTLRSFILKECYQVKKIEGLHHCTELEELKLYTQWNVLSIQSLGCMERLRTVHLIGMGKSVVEDSIQSLQKQPSEIIVCTRAVQNAASLVNSVVIPSLSVIDSCSNMQMNYVAPHLAVKQPTNGNLIIVCFVVSSPSMAQLAIVTKPGYDVICEVDVEEGR